MYKTRALRFFLLYLTFFFSTKVCLGNLFSLQGPLFVSTARIWFVELVLTLQFLWGVHSCSQGLILIEGAVGSAKPADRPDHEVDDPLYLMTLTIPQLFLKPLQVMWDATVFGVFNEHFPLYIKNEYLSEIAHDGQCLSISIIQLHMTETSMRAGNDDVYGFLEPQSIQRSRQSAHWQMVIILPKENLFVWFCLLHNRPDNYLKGIINSALKGLDDTPQPKSKAGARWIVVKTIGIIEIEGALHLEGKVLSES
ncbi:hypothetical protein HKD37_10G028009 [Glycine soja]